MITDDRAIRQLALRSDLPRLAKEGFHLFAVLEGEEQKVEEPAKLASLAVAFAALVAREEERSERPLPPVLPRAYKVTSRDDASIAVTLYCDLESPFERRRRDGGVLGIAKHLEARLRIYHGAFAYFAGDDLRGVDTIDAAGVTPLG